ncbi:hypothetical protein [Lysobacter sp. CA199]|uniref:hypothetical protein n=1 Tax=Lysobacter sp. CA199 TaxID=3455608 RepID=UPI003F8D84B9
MKMWRALLFATVAVGIGASSPTYAQVKNVVPVTKQQQAQKDQQERLQAVTRRGRLANYQQLLGTGNVRVASSASASDAASRDTAIDLAALGFTAADVQTYKKLNIDLFDIAHRFFGGTTSSSEAMLMADTIVIATAGDAQQERSRIDGFLAEIPFTVGKTLKGSRVPGDVVRIPRNSGPLPNGNYQKDFTDIDFVPGKKYLLVLSKNWYEQFVTLTNKQSESSFTALPHDAYEIADDGLLLRRSHSMQVGVNPKDIKSVEADLKSLSKRKNKVGGLQ